MGSGSPAPTRSAPTPGVAAAGDGRDPGRDSARGAARHDPAVPDLLRDLPTRVPAARRAVALEPDVTGAHGPTTTHRHEFCFRIGGWWTPQPGSRISGCPTMPATNGRLSDLVGGDPDGVAVPSRLVVPEGAGVLSPHASGGSARRVAHPPVGPVNERYGSANLWLGTLRGARIMSDGDTESNELACNELVELVTDYLEERLPDLDVERLEAHLSICEGCRNYVDQMRRRSTRSDTFPRSRSRPRCARSCSRRSTAGGASSDVTPGIPARLSLGARDQLHQPAAGRRRWVRGAARVGSRVRLPSIVLEIVAGIVIGPAVLGWVEVDEPIEVLNLIGLRSCSSSLGSKSTSGACGDGWFDFRRWGTLVSFAIADRRVSRAQGGRPDRDPAAGRDHPRVDLFRGDHPGAQGRR